MMKILITGATGFIGQQLVTHLKQHQLLILTRNISKATQLLGAQHQYIEQLNHLNQLNDIDVVINLAGEPIVGKRWSDKQKQLLEQSRFQITNQLSQLIQQSVTPPHTFISGSAIGYYGMRRDTQILDEDSAAINDFSHQLCRQWEQLALTSQTEQTRVVIIRIGIVLGKNGGALAKMLPAFKMAAGGKIASGQQGFSWIHQQDLIDIILFLINHPTCQGIYNATAPKPLSNQAFSQTLAQVLHRPAVVPMPEFVLNLAMGEMAQLLTKGQYVYPKHILQAGFNFKFHQLKPALEQLLC